MLCFLCPGLSVRPLQRWLPPVLPVSKLESAICVPALCHKEQAGLEVIESHQPLCPEDWDEWCAPPCQARNATTNFIFSRVSVSWWACGAPQILPLSLEGAPLAWLFAECTGLCLLLTVSPPPFHTSHLSPQPHALMVSSDSWGCLKGLCVPNPPSPLPPSSRLLYLVYISLSLRSLSNILSSAKKIVQSKTSCILGFLEKKQIHH